MDDKRIHKIGTKHGHQYSVIRIKTTQKHILANSDVSPWPGLKAYKLRPCPWP